MKYKLPQPEDYKEDIDYEFKLTKAYAETWGLLINSIMTIEQAIECLKDNDKEGAIHFLNRFLDKLKQ